MSPSRFSSSETHLVADLVAPSCTDCLRKGYSNETVARLNALKSALGLSRKRAPPLSLSLPRLVPRARRLTRTPSRTVMRIGKPLEHAQAAVKSLDIQDSVLKLTTVGRQVGYAGYLVHDMLVWVRTLFPTRSHRATRS